MKTQCKECLTYRVEEEGCCSGIKVRRLEQDILEIKKPRTDPFKIENPCKECVAWVEELFQ
jgi:hypothetical protein